MQQKPVNRHRIHDRGPQYRSGSWNTMVCIGSGACLIKRGVTIDEE